jgi:hypothetical protein
MKVIEFIKRNISVFSIITFVFLILVILLQLNTPETNSRACGNGYLLLGKLLLLACIFIFIVLNFILKKLVKNRINLNYLQNSNFIINLFILFIFK